MDAQAISKFIGVEESTEMVHMKKIQRGTKSTTMNQDAEDQPSLHNNQTDQKLCTMQSLYQPKNKKQENKYGFYVGTETRRIHCKRPDRKLSQDVK